MNTIFKPIAHSWVAIHSDPIGIVEFIGGALFGSPHCPAPPGAGPPRLRVRASGRQ